MKKLEGNNRRRNGEKRCMWWLMNLLLEGTKIWRLYMNICHAENLGGSTFCDTFHHPPMVTTWISFVYHLKFNGFYFIIYLVIYIYFLLYASKCIMASYVGPSSLIWMVVIRHIIDVRTRIMKFILHCMIIEMIARIYFFFFLHIYC